MKALAKGVCGHHLILDVEDVVRVEGDIVLLLAEGKYVRLTPKGSRGICFLEA